MFGGSKTPLKVKGNEQKEEASLPLSRAQKSCKVTKPRVIRAAKKENFTDGNQTRSPKRALKCPKGPEENVCPPQGAAGGWQLPGGCSGALRRDVLTEPPLPLHMKEHLSSSRAAPLGNDFCTPERDKAEGKPDFGLSEQRQKPVDFAAVISAECGTTQESFGTRPTGTSPTPLKFRRRSTIGLRGSPENNTLIRYLAQQRSSRQKEAFTQISPFKPANVRSLKDKINTFQASFESLQEAEGEPGLSHLGEPSQQGGSCKLIEYPAQNKAPFNKEPNLEQQSGKFMSGNRGAALKENLRENGIRSSRSELRICSILSPRGAVTVTDPAAAKEWVYEQQNPNKPLDTAVAGDTLEAGHVSQPCACSGGDSREHGGSGDAVAELSTREAGAVPGSPASSDLSQSSSLLRSILKKTPAKELVGSPRAESVLAPRMSLQEYLDSAVDGGGDEPAAVSNCVKASEALQTERTDSQSSKTPKKKKVTFGEVLSPEIFDQSLPANTPLRRGASPGCPQGQSPWARPGLSEEPLPLLDFGWDDEGVEPLPEFPEGSVAAESPSAVDSAEVSETDKPDVITAHSAKRKQVPPSTPNPVPQQCRAMTQEPDWSSSGAMNVDIDKDTKDPGRSKIQRQRNPTTAAPKKSQKKTRPSYGKRRKKKVKKSLYGEREMASKKPLLSPIPEIPEVFSSVASPSSPKADALSTEGASVGDAKRRDACRDTPQEPQAGRMRGKGLCDAALCPSPGLLEEAAAPSSGPGDAEVPGRLKPAPGAAPEKGEETPCEKEAKESSSLTEKEESQASLTGLEILERQDVQEGAQRAKCPQKDSVRPDPARRRRRRSSSAFYFPPVENLGITGADLPVCSYNVEEVLLVPRAKEGSLQACRRRSSASAEVRVRRSMRLSKDAATKGLAWIQLPTEIPEQPPLPAAPRARRSISTPILAGSENIHPREQNLLPLPAPGKENEDSAPLAGPGRRWRRRSVCEATAQETPWAPTQRRRSTNSVCGKDRSEQKHLEAAEILELRLKDVSGISDCLK